MKIGALKENFKGENRVSMTPASALQLQKLGHECFIEAGAGAAARFADSDYEKAGVTVVKSPADLFKCVDFVTKVRPPEDAEVKKLREGQTLISFFYPAQNEKLMKACAGNGSTVIAMDMVPRISRAQKMDALSSMANIAGYRAVIEAGNNFGRFFTGPGDGGRQGSSGQSIGHRGRCGRTCGYWCCRSPSVRSSVPSMCARKWPNRSRVWAQNSCSSILKKMPAAKAAMLRRLRLSSGKSSWSASVNRRLMSISSSPRRSSPAGMRRNSGSRTWWTP